MNITGKVIGKKEKSFKNDFKICEVYLDTTEGEYPNKNMVEFKGKNFEKAGMVKEGGTYTFEFNIKGREWEKNGKKGLMQTLEAWRFEEVSGASNDDDGLPF
jgi:hypothetical protein